MGDAGGVLGNGRDWELWMERHAGASRQQTQPITARADPTNSPPVSVTFLGRWALSMPLWLVTTFYTYLQLTPPSPLPSGSGRCKPCVGALLDDVPLELRQRPEN